MASFTLRTKDTLVFIEISTSLAQNTYFVLYFIRTILVNLGLKLHSLLNMAVFFINSQNVILFTPLTFILTFILNASIYLYLNWQTLTYFIRIKIVLTSFTREVKAIFVTLAISDVNFNAILISSLIDFNTISIRAILTTFGA